MFSRRRATLRSPQLNTSHLIARANWNPSYPHGPRQPHLWWSSGTDHWEHSAPGPPWKPNLRREHSGEEAVDRLRGFAFKTPETFFFGMFQCFLRSKSVVGCGRLAARLWSRLIMCYTKDSNCNELFLLLIHLKIITWIYQISEDNPYSRFRKTEFPTFFHERILRNTTYDFLTDKSDVILWSLDMMLILDSEFNCENKLCQLKTKKLRA